MKKILQSANETTNDIINEMASHISVLDDPTGTDPVLLRIENDGRMIAFFPGQYESDRQVIGCYAYIGQHSEASIDYIDRCELLDFIANPSQESDAREFLSHLPD